MIETVLAVLVITFLFFFLFWLSRLLTGKILVQHAAMRVARARAVGCSEFHCLKTARVAVLPVAGRRLWPEDGDERLEGANELALVRMYMRTPDSLYASGLLRYENWDRMTVTIGDDGPSSVSMKTEWFTLRGEAIVDNYPVYMERQGL